MRLLDRALLKIIIEKWEAFLSTLLSSNVVILGGVLTQKKPKKTSRYTKIGKLALVFFVFFGFFWFFKISKLALVFFGFFLVFFGFFWHWVWPEFEIGN